MSALYLPAPGSPQLLTFGLWRVQTPLVGRPGRVCRAVRAQAREQRPAGSARNVHWRVGGGCEAIANAVMVKLPSVLAFCLVAFWAVVVMLLRSGSSPRSGSSSPT